MPPDWKVIKAAREDLTDWVIHRTTYQFTPGEKYLRTFETLKLILQSGDPAECAGESGQGDQVKTGIRH
jgi:hypothetical protein